MNGTECIMGVDFGTSKVASVLIDIDILSGSFASVQIESFHQNQDERKKELFVENVVSAFCACMRKLFDGKSCSLLSIGLTGQMHGILGIDQNGEPATPFVSWQDERGLAQGPDGISLLKEMQQKAGFRPIASGYGIVTLYDWMKQGTLQGIRQVCTLPDYFAMRMTGATEACTDFTMAESIGAFDLRKSAWDEQYLSLLGISPALLPSAVPPTSLFGKLDTTACGFGSLGRFAGTPIATAIGDNQASFIGSVLDYFSTILVNMGTGSQASYAVRSLEDEALDLSAIDGYDVCLRPFINRGFLIAANALSGGASYVSLHDFFAEIGERLFQREAPIDLWKRMNALAEEAGRADGLRVDPLFAGKRSDPGGSGSIHGIRASNFRPHFLIYATLEGMVRVLYEMVGKEVVQRVRFLVGSGNGMRRNALLRKITSQIFQKELSVPCHEEEAAVGAAINGAVAAGVYKDFQEAAPLIRY